MRFTVTIAEKQVKASSQNISTNIADSILTVKLITKKHKEEEELVAGLKNYQKLK